MTVQHRILCFEVRELNLRALAQHLDNTAAPRNVLPPSADLVSPLSPRVVCGAQTHWTSKPLWWKPSWRYGKRLQSNTQQHARRNTPRGNKQQITEVYQAEEL
jgi:hypothetical protein